MSLDSLRCEVYNADYNPIGVVPAWRAITLIYKGRATILTEHPSASVSTVDTRFPVPSQILLKTMVRSRPRKVPQLTQKNLFIRDSYRCVYCGRHRLELKDNESLTRDHVIPKDKGGKDIWTNVVTACKTCNNRKANYSLDESGLRFWKSGFVPKAPGMFEIWQKKYSYKSIN